jgi:predicted N-acetyltransferase YhbS
MNEFTITQANENDLPAILDVQKKAFLEVAKTFHLKSLPPLEQSLESLTDDFAKGMVLKVSIDKVIVGSVRAYQKDNTCHIGRLVVLPEYQNRGIGKALMHEIENQHANIVKRYEIFTGVRDSRNRHFYDQLGYRPFKTENLNDEISFVFMEKSA